MVITRSRGVKYIAFLIIAALAFSLGLAVISPVQVRAADDWLIMVYLNGDNTTEVSSIQDFLGLSAMAELTPATNVHILVQFDRAKGTQAGYDNWETTRRYEIVRGTQPTNSDPNLIVDLGELDMGDPQTLVDFVSWARGYHPAGRYCLVIQDHGNGWLGVSYDDTNGSDYLTMGKLASALNTVTNSGASKIELVCFDACVMAMAEVDYQIEPYCNARVSSEDIGMEGVPFPYDPVIGDLIANPEMDENQLAELFVERQDEWPTLSAVDFSQGYDDLVGAVHILGNSLVELKDDYYIEIWNAARQARCFPAGTSSDLYVDLYDLAKRLRDSINDAYLKDRSQVVMDCVTNVVIAEKHSEYMSGVHGITIEFASSMKTYPGQYDASSGLLRFTACSRWDEFLKDFLSGVPSNLSGSINGGKVVDYSSEDMGPAADIIDCGFTGWNAIGLGNYVTVELAGDSDRPVGSVAIDPGGNDALSDFEIQLSKDGKEFETAYSGFFSADDRLRLNTLDLSPLQKTARYVKIIDKSPPRMMPAVSVAELQVFSPPLPFISGLSSVLLRPGTDVTVSGANFGEEQGSSYISFGSIAAADYKSWSDSEIKCRVPEGLDGNEGVTVTTFAGTSNAVDFEITYPSWYLAEGSTAWGFSTYITIVNPNEKEVTARVTYTTPDGPAATRDLRLPPVSQTTIDPKWDLESDTDFATHIECLEKETIAVDRTMSWTGPGAQSPEAHSSVGVTSSSNSWYLPEGCSDYGFETWLLVQNPGNEDANVEVTYMTEGWGSSTTTRNVPANSRQAFNMKDDIGERNASIKVVSDFPVVSERAMYRDNRREGSNSIGVTAPSTEYYLAEGTTAWGFSTYIAIQNPHASEAQVTLTYMTPTGLQVQGPVSLPPKSRWTIRVNDALPTTDFSTCVNSNLPVVVERSMYWGEGTALREACHDSVGYAEPHRVFYLPDGQTSEGRETYTLVANPNDSEVKIEIRYLGSEGKRQATVEETIPAKSRRTFEMDENIPDGRAAVVVASLTPGFDIIAERSMYWNARGVGTCTIGGYSD